MIRTYILISLSLSTSCLLGQNCNIYLFEGDTLQYDACIVAEKRAGNNQFSKPYQDALDESLAMCDYFAPAYRHKSVAYLKSGDFINWKSLMDKAVELDPETYLGYRGWCRYQFFRDYEGAIADIERLDGMIDYDMGQCLNGDYHLKIALGLFYKELGQRAKAIEIIESYMNSDIFDQGSFDYVHLGVLYLEEGDFLHAIELFEKQTNINPLADNHYYKAIALDALGKKTEAQSSLSKALELYDKGYRMQDVYTHKTDEIYRSMIVEKLDVK